jgi:hypothetical protein
MSSQSATIVQRLWNYCNVLRDDGVSSGDYVEQRLRQAVPKRAFDGKLVPQDPNDEPAAVLLEKRLRAGKTLPLDTARPT